MTPPIESPKTRLKPKANHITATAAIHIKLWSMVEMTFLFLTIPPYKYARPGVMIKTRAVEVNIHATSAGSYSYADDEVGKAGLKKAITTKTTIKRNGKNDFF